MSSAQLKRGQVLRTMRSVVVIVNVKLSCFVSVAPRLKFGTSASQSPERTVVTLYVPGDRSFDFVSSGIARYGDFVLTG